MYNEDAKEKLANEVIKDFVWRRRWRLLTWIGVSIFAMFAVVKYLLANGLPTLGEQIAVIGIKGEIGQGQIASAEKVVPVLRSAFNNENVKVVILDINSGGGSPSDAERIISEIDRLKKTNPKPIISVIGTLGASAAYMIAVHTDKIVAGNYSLVGSIGVIMQGYDAHKLAERMDIKQHVYASGPFKDLMNPLREPTEAEKEVLQQIVDNAAKTFIAEVRTKRGKKLTRDDIFTGQVWNGSEAIQLGLIDNIGTLESVAADYSDLKVANFGPNFKSPFAANFAHELGAGFAEGALTLAKQQIEYVK
ncbi:MAG: signal peptide peptidase SppA [Pseudomonadales bacterium]|nr:signal peptide peptidase SppA [Pseudomonadales bacterium]